MKKLLNMYDELWVCPQYVDIFMLMVVLIKFYLDGTKNELTTSYFSHGAKHININTRFNLVDNIVGKETTVEKVLKKNLWWESSDLPFLYTSYQSSKKDIGLTKFQDRALVILSNFDKSDSEEFEKFLDKLKDEIEKERAWIDLSDVKTFSDLLYTKELYT